MRTVSDKIKVVTRPCRVCGKRSELRVSQMEVARWGTGDEDFEKLKRELLVSGVHAACRGLPGEVLYRALRPGG